LLAGHAAGVVSLSYTLPETALEIKPTSLRKFGYSLKSGECIPTGTVQTIVSTFVTRRGRILRTGPERSVGLDHRFYLECQTKSQQGAAKGESRGAKPLWQGSGDVPQTQFPSPFLARKGAGGWSKKVFHQPAKDYTVATRWTSRSQAVEFVPESHQVPGDERGIGNGHPVKGSIRPDAGRVD